MLKQTFRNLYKLFSISEKRIALSFLEVQPVSRSFGLDRGKPVDRYYIEKFLGRNSQHIKGHVLEISDSVYSKQFGKDVDKFDVLKFNDGKEHSNNIGDLTNKSTLPENKIDCFICTQTLNFIYDFNSAIQGIQYILKPKGVALITVSGIAQISRYDADRWGDFWRFTPQSIKRVFENIFGKENVTMEVMGNSYSATMLLKGFSLQDCDIEKLDIKDEDYPVIIGLFVRKLK